MSDKTGIEWTDATWNPITGCSVVSAGCKHCYAMKLAGTRLQHHPSRAGLTQFTNNGPVWTGEVRFNEQWIDQPMKWTRPRMIFVCAHGDLFHESVPFEWIDKVFAVMALADQHIFQVLTKRPERMLQYFQSFKTPEAEQRGWNVSEWAWHKFNTGISSELNIAQIPKGLPNVWIGVSVENQETSDERIPLLLQTPAAVRWISAEPLLGSVDLGLLGTLPRSQHTNYTQTHDLLHWVVCGGESGSSARPMHPDWARSLRDQCQAAGVPFLFKQWGEWAPNCLCRKSTGCVEIPRPQPGKMGCMFRCGKKGAGRLLDGIQHDGYPMETA